MNSCWSSDFADISIANAYLFRDTRYAYDAWVTTVRVSNYEMPSTATEFEHFWLLIDIIGQSDNTDIAAIADEAVRISLCQCFTFFLFTAMVLRSISTKCNSILHFNIVRIQSNDTIGNRLFLFLSTIFIFQIEMNDDDMFETDEYLIDYRTTNSTVSSTYDDDLPACRVTRYLPAVNEYAGTSNNAGVVASFRAPMVCFYSYSFLIMCSDTVDVYFELHKMKKEQCDIIKERREFVRFHSNRLRSRYFETANAIFRFFEHYYN